LRRHLPKKIAGGEVINELPDVLTALPLFPAERVNGRQIRRKTRRFKGIQAAGMLCA
jgi:hypothetical protein